MRVPIDEVVTFDCITEHPTTGAVTDADSTPTFEVFEDTTDTDIGVGGNLTKRTSKTGDYRGSFTASAANGFEAGKWYNVIASATVNSIAGKAVVFTFMCVPAESSAGVPKTDVSHFGGSAGSFSSGIPAVNTTQIEGSDATNQIRDSVVDDATRIDASALNTLSSHDPGENIMGATDTVVLTDSSLTAAKTATDFVEELRNAITGGAYALNTDSNGSVRIVDGTGTGELDTGSGRVLLTAATETQIDDIQTAIGSAGAGLTAVPWNSAWDTEVESEVQDAIEANHLDHLLAATYNPASKPGAADSLFNAIFENDGGVPRFTANSLELGPVSGTDWTADQKSAIITILGIPASGSTPEYPTDGVLKTIADELNVTHQTIDSILEEVAINIPAELAALPTRSEITGGNYALNTDASGSIRIVDGTGTGELDTNSGRVNLSAATEAQIDAIEADTNELQSDWANGGRLDLILDSILADTAAWESAGSIPGAGAPSATATPLQQLAFVYKSWRNKSTVDGSEHKLFGEDGTTVHQKAAVSDNGTTFTRGPMVAA